MSEEDYFPDTLMSSFPSHKKPSSSLFEDKLSKEILPYEIEISSKNSDIIFPLYEKMRYNKMKELVSYDKYIGRYIITKNVKNLNSSSNNNGIIWKINAIDNLMLKLEQINNNSSLSLSSDNNTINNGKYKLIDLGDKENMDKIFLVEYAFLSKSYPDNFILIVSNFYNNYSLISKEANGEVSYCGFVFNFSSSMNSISSTMILDSDKGLIFHEKIRANSLLDIKSIFSNNSNMNKNIFFNEANWNNNTNNNLLINIFSNNINLYKNFLLCMDVIKKYKIFLRNIEYKEIEITNLRKHILYEIVYDNNLYLLLDYNMMFDSYLLKKYFDGEQKWVNLSNINTNNNEGKNNKNINNNNLIINKNNSILCNILKGLVCMSSLQNDNLNCYSSSNFSNINNFYFNRYNYEFENTITIPIFDNPLEESNIILNNRKELLSHFECSKCTYKINNFESYLCQTCKKLYHRECIDKDENKNPLLYHYFFCNNINCSPCVICKSNQSQLNSDKYKCQKCKFVFHSKCLIKEIKEIYISLNHNYYLCQNCIKCCKCGLNAYNINVEKKDNKFNCQTNMCLYCERKISKKEFCPICDDLWYSKDNNLLIECTKCKYFYHKACDRILFSCFNNINNIYKKNKYLCPFCRINKKTNILSNLIKELKSLDQNEYFIEPVDLKAIPNYDKVIKNPICFKDIETKNSKDNIYLKDMDEFFTDIYLIVDNAMLFNMPRTPVFEVASDMKKEITKKLNEKYKLLYQLSIDYWLFDYSDIFYIKKSIEERLNHIKNNLKNIFLKYILNRKKKEENEYGQNNNNQNNNANNKENINPESFKDEILKFGNEYIQQNIFDYYITWSWLTDLGLIPYNKDIKISNVFNSNIADNYVDSKNINSDVYINIDQKNPLISYANIYTNINNNGKIIKKKFKTYDEISYELDFHNSNFESSKKYSKLITNSNNISHTMDLILNKNSKNLEYLDTNELIFNNYEKNIDNDKKLSFLYPDKFRYYLPTERQNLKSSFNDFMSSFILRLEDNKKGSKLKKKFESNNNDKENNFDLEENEDYNNDDRNDQDYTIPGFIKNKNTNGNKSNKKKKKLNKIKSIKLSQKRQRDSINIDNDNSNASENSIDNKNIESNKKDKNQNILINNKNNINIDINTISDNIMNANEYIQKEIIKKLSNKYITICFSKFSLIFEPNCSLCGSFEDSDKLLFCRNCENAFHYYCIDGSIDINKIKELNNWRCSFCKICSKCGEKISINDVYKNKNLLFCKSCDNCYHRKCLPFVMNSESYKFKCEKCFKCIMCKSNKYFTESFPLKKNKDYSFFTRDYEYCYECGITIFSNSLCNKCLLSDFKNYSKKLIFIKTRKDFENFENDSNINCDIIIDINENLEKNNVSDKYIIMIYCESCNSWCHCTCYGMNYLEIKKYYNKFKDMNYFICLDCFLRNRLEERYNKLSVLTYLEILSTSFKLMVLSKIIMIILKGHYKEVNSSVKLHSKLIKVFIKNNYEIMLENKNIQMLFILFKLDIFLIKESNSNFSSKKYKKIKVINNNINHNIKDQILNNYNQTNDIKSINNDNINNKNYNENINNAINIKYDILTEMKLNEINKEQTVKNVNNNIYWKKHLLRILLKKYKRKSLYHRLKKRRYLLDIERLRDYNYNYHFNKTIYKYENLIPHLIDDKNKFNTLTYLDLRGRTQSEINFNVKNFFKSNEDSINQMDYPSDIDLSFGEDENEKDIKNDFLGSKTKRSNSSENNNTIKKNEKDKKKKCYYVAYGDKKKFRKLLKKFTKNSVNNDKISNIKHYMPNSIIEMYEYNVNDFFKLDEEEEKSNHDMNDINIKNKSEIKNINKNDKQINIFVKELYYNLISLKNNYDLKKGEKIINYNSKINTLIISVIFESIRYIRELLLNWLINNLLEESMNNNIYKNVEDIISKSESSPNNINIDELNKYYDYIDKLIDSPNSHQECALCHRKGGRELSGRLIYLKNDFWVHINCLYWSKSLIINNNDNEISQVETVINKSSQYKCFLCKGSGATIFCNVPKCERKYHFLCGYLKKCSFMKDNKVFCNRCAHCHKDDTEEVVKMNLHKYYIIKNNKDNNISESNLGNAFKDSNTPKYQVGIYNKIGNNTILKLFQINSKDLSFEALDLAIIKVKLITNNIEMLGINESGAYFFKNTSKDINKIKNCIIKNNINTCRQKSDFEGLIQDIFNKEGKDNENDIEKQYEEKNIKIHKNITTNDYIYIQPLKNKDNSLNLNYCKNRIERDENVEYILSELNKKFLNFKDDNNEINNIKNQKKYEIFKYFNFGFDIKKIYSSNNPISIIHQYLAKLSQNLSYLNTNDNIYLNMKYSDTIKDMNNIDNKDDHFLNDINNSVNINSLVGSHSPKSNEINSEVNSINISTSNIMDANKETQNISIHINNQTKQTRKNKVSNANYINNLSNINLAKLDYFVPLINQKNKINLKQTNHLCFKLENYINTHQELITGKTKLNDELNIKEDNNIFNQTTSKKPSNKKYNTKTLDIESNYENKDNLSEEQIISQKYKSYINQQNQKVCIGPSIIHRNGLFAVDNIKPGEIVIEYVGEMITNKIADYREIEYNERGFGDCYMFRFDADNIIDATKYGNLARFINHCCEPNCKAQCNEINGKKHILLLAKRFIKAGEEITYDYNFEVESEKIQCRCGAKNCRGRLN